MKRILTTIFIAASLFAAVPVYAAKEWKAEKLEKCDPYMKLQGGYGYLVKDDAKAAVWWAEGVYKPMKDTPVAQRKGRRVLRDQPFALRRKAQSLSDFFDFFCHRSFLH